VETHVLKPESNEYALHSASSEKKLHNFVHSCGIGVGFSTGGGSRIDSGVRAGVGALVRAGVGAGVGARVGT
jgi:acetyltransferase-like isoleucine patch superfamily enzyme